MALTFAYSTSDPTGRRIDAAFLAALTGILAATDTRYPLQVCIAALYRKPSLDVKSETLDFAGVAISQNGDTENS